MFHELGPLTNRPAFQLVFNRLSGLLLICWQVHALQQGPHSVPILGRAHVVHRSLSHSFKISQTKKNMAMRKKKWFHPGRLTWNLKITQLKSTIIWTKPSFSGSMFNLPGCCSSPFGPIIYGSWERPAPDPFTILRLDPLKKISMDTLIIHSLIWISRKLWRDLEKTENPSILEDHI